MDDCAFSFDHLPQRSWVRQPMTEDAVIQRHQIRDRGSVHENHSESACNQLLSDSTRTRETYTT